MKIGVIGAGTMGQGIAKAFAQVEGNTVALCDIKQEWAENGLAKIKKGYGMHFFNPADRMKLIEVIAGCNTPAETVEKIKEISVAIGKNPVQVNEAAGFVVNRILIPMINEAAFIKMEGVSNIAGIDTAMKLGANHPMGPLELGDFIGLDICLAIMDVLYHETGDSKYRACPLIRKMVRGGNLGCKTGKGFYVYNADRTKTPVDEL